MITSRLGDAIFLHNGDFSGDVIITNVHDEESRVVVPYTTLQAFLAQKTVRELIGVIEQLDLENEDERNLLNQLAQVVS